MVHIENQYQNVALCVTLKRKFTFDKENHKTVGIKML